MKVALSGGKTFNDYSLFCEIIEKAIAEFGQSISTILSTSEKGVNSLGEKYAKEKGINLIKYPANWNDINHPDAVVKERENPWKKKIEKYNSKAGFIRDKKLIDDSDAIISIDIDYSANSSMLKLAREKNIKIYEYRPDSIEEELEGYIF